MADINIVYRNSTWEGYTVHVLNAKNTDEAFQEIEAFISRGEGSKITAIVRMEKLDEDETGRKVPQYLEMINDHDNIPKALYDGRGGFNIGADRIVPVSQDSNSSFDSAAWVVFRFRDKHYKWTGRHVQSNTVIWDKADMVVEVEAVEIPQPARTEWSTR